MDYRGTRQTVWRINVDIYFDQLQHVKGLAICKMKYYYNNVPGKGLCRNNLIYTSPINEDKTEFCMWFNNDTDYHKGQNEVVDPELMDIKFRREKDCCY